MSYMPKNIQEVDAIENWWAYKAQRNFLAYRMYMRHGIFKPSWFTTELCRVFQQFYQDYKNRLRPVYIINTPPQHGKSFGVMDLISWILGDDPSIMSIYASYAERLGKRCNKALQRTFEHEKYRKIFPNLNVTNPKNKGEYNSGSVDESL